MTARTTWMSAAIVFVGLTGSGCRVLKCDVLYDAFDPIVADDGMPAGFTTATAYGETLTLMVVPDLWNPAPLPLSPWLGGLPGLTEAGRGSRRPQGLAGAGITDLEYVRLNDVDITLGPSKTAIDQTDHLDFRVAWTRPLSGSARAALSETFELVAFPNDYVLVYAGPAPQGLELAAAIGIRQAEMRVDTADLELAPGESWPALIEEFLVTVDPDDDVVRINGITAMQLSAAAHVLD